MDRLRELIDSEPENATRTVAQIRTWLRETVREERKLVLERLVTLLDDAGALAVIQSHAAAAQRALDAGGQPSAVELTCLDAAAFMRTARDYGRESANWAKSRHLARLDALLAVNVIDSDLRALILDESAHTVTLRLQLAGLPADMDDASLDYWIGEST